MAQLQLIKNENCPVNQSFLIQIKFRQNHNWQGTIQWFEGQKKLPFRSLLEMIQLIDNALDKTSSAEDQQNRRTWD